MTNLLSTASRTALLSTGLEVGGLALAALAVALAPGCASQPSGFVSEVHQWTDVVVPPPLEVIGTVYEAAAIVELPMTSPEESHGLHNVYRLGEHIVSGSEPHGAEAFAKLQEMGVKTVLSVDGKVPDAELAAQYGLSYVHVPIRYSGIEDDALAKIAKTYREQEGPFYVHCFHGKHRGPAAAEIGRLVLDGLPREYAIAEMRQWCGTSPSYEGLYRVVAEAEIPTVGETKTMDWDFPAAHPFEGFRHGMIEVTRNDDNVKYLAKHGWKPTAEHPDLNAVNEAAKLAGSLQQCLDLAQAEAKPADFLEWMGASVTSADALRVALERFEGGDLDAADDAKAAYDGISQACKACHVAYRN